MKLMLDTNTCIALINRKPVHGPLTIHVRDRIQVGNVVLELHQ